MQISRRNVLASGISLGVVSCFYPRSLAHFFSKGSLMTGNSSAVPGLAVSFEFEDLSWLSSLQSFNQLLSNLPKGMRFDGGVMVVTDLASQRGDNPGVYLGQINTTSGRLSNVESPLSHVGSDPVIVYTSGRIGRSLKVPKKMLHLSSSAHGKFENPFIGDCTSHYLNHQQLLVTDGQYSSYLLDKATRPPVQLFLQVPQNAALDPHIYKLAQAVSLELADIEKFHLAEIAKVLPVYSFDDLVS